MGEATVARDMQTDGVQIRWRERKLSDFEPACLRLGKSSLPTSVSIVTDESWPRCFARPLPQLGALARHGVDLQAEFAIVHRASVKPNARPRPQVRPAAAAS
jgi:hypothetical protein